MPTNPDEVPYPEGLELRTDGTIAYLRLGPGLSQYQQPLTPLQLRRLGTEAQQLAADLLSDTPTEPHGIITEERTWVCRNTVTAKRCTPETHKPTTGRGIHERDSIHAACGWSPWQLTDVSPREG